MVRLRGRRKGIQDPGRFQRQRLTCPEAKVRTNMARWHIARKAMQMPNSFASCIVGHMSSPSQIMFKCSEFLGGDSRFGEELSDEMVRDNAGEVNRGSLFGVPWVGRSSEWRCCARAM